jgi:hypothetical protein
MQHRAALIDDAERIGLERLGRRGAGEERDAGEKAGDAGRKAAG